MKIINMNAVPEKALPGRFMKSLISPDTVGSCHLSVCLIRVPLGEEVMPAHLHQTQEEVLFVLEGSGLITINDESMPINAGDAIYIPKGSIHKLENRNNSELRVLCCFSPPVNPGD